MDDISILPEKEISEYNVVGCVYSWDLNKEINELLQNGWHVKDKLVIRGDRTAGLSFIQLMVKYKE